LWQRIRYLFSSPNYLRPDISKGITTRLWQRIRYLFSSPNYLRPDISKGITTFAPPLGLISIPSII
jgi:hypothetical protein